jgi:phage repressor protein C with HTH and peptisase S24 domain
MSEFEINKRVKAVQIYSGLNQKDFAGKIGVSYTTVNEVLNNKKGPGMNVIQGIAFAFIDISDEWLLTGKGSMTSDMQDKSSADLDPDEKLTTIPYFPDINASAGLDFLTENSTNYSIPMSIPNVDAQAFINVFGDSMDPKYCSGEIIGIKEIGKEFVMYGYAYVVHMVDGEAYLKYIKKGKDTEHWILASENPRYEPKEFHLSNIHKVYIIKAVISKTTIL